VTLLITLGMTFCLIWVRQLSVMIRSLRHFSDIDQEIFEGLHRQAVQEARARPLGALSPDEIAAIPSFKLTPEDIKLDNEEKDVCVICQDDFQVGDQAKRLLCRHLFHVQCIDAWLERSSLCPICNGDARSIV